jgi:dihydrolipoamide dehydrogenase
MAGTYARSTEVVVVGGGPAGYMAAIRAGQLGKKVLLVERGELGGECLNRGCIPSKALIHASRLFDAVRREGPEIGVLAPESRFDAAQAIRWKDSVVAKERTGVASLLASAGVTVMHGIGRFTGPKSLDVEAADGGHERVDFAYAIVAVGAVHIALPGFEPDGTTVLQAPDILALTALPKSLTVLGGGVSGCELAQYLAQVGVRVTVVELMPQILPGMDPDLARELTGALERAGVRVLTGTRATKLERSAGSVRLTVTKPEGAETIESERLFLSVGKRPASRELGLEEAGVAVDAKSGFVTVDDRQRTNVPHIFAAGDLARPPMLAHKAYREGIVAAEAIAGLATRFDVRAMPSVVFTAPELMSVGLTKVAADAQGLTAREVRFPFAALGRAHASHATGGWLKVVAEDGSGRLLGVHAAGESVGEFAAEAALAVEMGATVRDVALTVHPHPTFSEALGEACWLWLGEPMHVARRAGPGRAGGR